MAEITNKLTCKQLRITLNVFCHKEKLWRPTLFNAVMTGLSAVEVPFDKSPHLLRVFLRLGEHSFVTE